MKQVFFLLPLIFASAVVPGFLSAADNDFVTVVKLGIEVDGNPDVTGESADSEQLLSLELDLKWRSSTPRTSLEFDYSPSIRRYLDNDTLGSNDSHLIRGGLRHEMSKNSAFNLTVNGSSSEQQGRLGPEPQAPVTLIPRTRIRRGWINLNWSHTTASGNEWRYGIRAQTESYDDAVTAALLDTDRFGGGVEWSYPISRLARMGVQINHETAKFASEDDTDIDSLAVFYQRQLSERMKGNVAIGISRVDTMVTASSSLEPAIRLSLSRGIAQKASLELSLETSSKGGFGLPSASRDTGLDLRWNRIGMRVTGSVRIGWWDRELVEAGGAGFEGARSLVSNESLSWRLGRRWTLGLFHEYRKQDPKGGDLTLVTADDHAGGLLLRFSSEPLSRKR